MQDVRIRLGFVSLRLIYTSLMTEQQIIGSFSLSRGLHSLQISKKWLPTPHFAQQEERNRPVLETSVAAVAAAICLAAWRTGYF